MSARIPESAGQFLVTPGDRMFDDIQPQHLLSNSENVTANIIHEAVYAARPDVKVRKIGQRKRTRYYLVGFIFFSIPPPSPASIRIIEAIGCALAFDVFLLSFFDRS